MQKNLNISSPPAPSENSHAPSPSNFHLDIPALVSYIAERTFNSGIQPLPRTLPPNPPEFELRLRHLLRHAARVFAQKGYGGASIRDISRSSRISLGGIYYYGKSKQQLLYLIQKYNFTELLERLESRLLHYTDPVERLQLFISNHLDYFLRHPVEMKVLSHEEDALSEPYRREIQDIKRRYYRVARGLFEDLRDAGHVRRVSPRLAVLSLFGMMNWMYKWYNPKVDPASDRLAEAMAGLFLRGVMTHNGNGQAARPSAPRPQARPSPDTPQPSPQIKALPATD